MQEDWEKGITFVLAAEGGYDNNPNDKGGETNFGISKRRYPNEDIKAMTVDRAKELYRKDFWEKLCCDQLPSPLAIAVFDAAVNQGEGAAARMLQIVVGANVDGIVGPNTVTATFKAGDGVLRKFMAQRMARYVRTVMKDFTQDAFTENWSNRLMRLAQVVFSEKNV